MISGLFYATIVAALAAWAYGDVIEDKLRLWFSKPYPYIDTKGIPGAGSIIICEFNQWMVNCHPEIVREYIAEQSKSTVSAPHSGGDDVH